MSHRKKRLKICIPRGYNWCGPGCSGQGAPVNGVDALCKQHDYCYQHSKNKCECDQAFLTKLQPKIDMTTREGRHAHLIYQYMKLQTFFTCHPTRKMK
ncbi:phospholipase [Gracilibacillus oryzae]|uniref:Phospholipase n=1 Tax=Gracilibacillus oryzae TaxID=1672701 RepID=A0A7C8GRZ7_9BACI|nr:phospholipase [Gracilibacillus oryzae]KAB8130723.1 phospholipase [Gracilibacillus oryzae]